MRGARTQKPPVLSKTKSVFPSDSFKWENQVCDDKRFLRRKNPAPRHHTSYKLSTKSRFEKNKKPGLFYKRFLWRKKLIQIVNQK